MDFKKSIDDIVLVIYFKDGEIVVKFRGKSNRDVNISIYFML